MAKRMSPSEEVLAWLVCKNPALFENKYCLELGAGLGLAGLMYAASVERVGGE
jgi:tRNA1(Val) A37 N6-methylase TrmN6